MTNAILSEANVEKGFHSKFLEYMCLIQRGINFDLIDLTKQMVGTAVSDGLGA